MNEKNCEKQNFVVGHINPPPKPNTMVILSEGWGSGGKTVIYIYRPKKFNWLQRKLWKWAFGITIKHGEDLSII